MNNERIVLGGGCFWCTEAVFLMLKGVRSVVPGYAGGHTKNPTYDEVSSGETGHAEVIEVTYDANTISLEDICTVFFATHDATQINRQGNDIGSQYRSIILYTTEAQKNAVLFFIHQLSTSAKEGNPIVTEVAPLTTFYKAEQEHLDYYRRNKNQGYCQVIIAPKLQKVQKDFQILLRNNS